ncbi:hypothetical protein BKA69DRAFT_1086309 [Paraphysoderma sedebokerense]|nr:hypothetical protein BKA69DRAFT_1086309 [Paraphysoderma sedebokerense]
MNDKIFWHNMPQLRELILTSLNRTGGIKASEVRVSYDLLAKLKRFSARVKVTQLPKSLPFTLEHLELIDCKYVENPEALSTCRRSLHLQDVRVQSPLALHSSLAHLDINESYIKLIDLPPSLISLTYYAVRHHTLPEALPAGLQYLNCSSNEWGSLSYLPSGLKFLNCSNNKLNSIENLPSSLEVLICDQNNLKSFASLPPSLKMLSCSGNPLWDYFSSSNLQSWPPYLKALSVRCGTIRKGLGSSLPSSLLFFDCGYNRLRCLPLLPPSLEELVCDLNELESLSPLPATLRVLLCGRNKLTCLPMLPKSIRVIDADPKVSVPPLSSLKPYYRHKNEWEKVDNWKNIYTRI